MNLTIAFITSRKEPKIQWFFDSLNNQSGYPNDGIEKIIVNNQAIGTYKSAHDVTVTQPKPTIWQGKHRITKEDWWAKSNAMNTAIILCKTEWIAFVDDRCVLSDNWLQCAREAMEGNYAVVGSYEKRANMRVENGVITDWGTELGVDTRLQHGRPVLVHDWYGGSCALPLEWCLAVNGFSEDVCDGLGSEDSMFGVTLRNAGLPMKFDSRMRLIEDRTPTEIDGALKRADKNSHLGQQAKSWGIVRAFQFQDTSGNSYDIRQHRARVQNGEDLQTILPSASHFDWYDGQFLGDMT